MSATGLRMRIRCGTSGFAYKEWKGSFYPADLPDSRMLQYYASQLPAVEINNTFYRMPRESVLLHWAGQVPGDFTFVLKASQWITHRKRLKDATDPLRYLIENSAALGNARGPFLFQLPPNMKKDTGRLDDFLALVPDGVRAAFEFRHTSWHDEDVFAVLRSHGAALCVADTEEDATPLTATADWGYLRLRREAYDDTRLIDWCDWIHAQPWSEAFVFFKHEDGATGPRLARRFCDLFESRADSSQS